MMSDSQTARANFSPFREYRLIFRRYAGSQPCCFVTHVGIKCKVESDMQVSTSACASSAATMS